MPMSFGGRAASSSGCAIRPRGHETGSTGSIGRTPSSSPTGHYVMATAEHREPCESRGSCTVLGAPGDETPPGDSTVKREGAAIGEGAVVVAELHPILANGAAASR